MAYTTIKKPSDYFNTKLYSGNSTTSTNITGVGFQPDLTWIKNRTGAFSHILTDAVRGANKQVFSDNTSAETTYAQELQGFISDGFTVGSDNDVNGSSYTYASWNWKANGAGSSNTDGSITSTVSANTTSGFSIVSYTGNNYVSTIGHGLNVAPKVVFIKSRSNVENWQVYHSGLGATDRYLELNTTSAYSTGYNHFNATAPTSSVFSVGATTGANGSGYTYVAYCFAEKQGYSKFGSYTGNGNADGTFVYTGFKPAFMMVKRTDGGQPWVMTDSTRSTYNITSHFLSADSSDAEASYTYFDILSNGFKCRNASDFVNVSGGSYIYMAFAEEPLVGDNPATAR